MFGGASPVEKESAGPSRRVKTIIYVLISLALLVVYCLQVNKFTTQAGVWIGVILLGGGLLWFEQGGEFLLTILLFLIGSSAGMVISNANIKIA